MFCRSVEPIQRSLALGLQTLLIRGLGTVPGPVVFGYLIDITCVMWHITTVDDKQMQNMDSSNVGNVENNGSCRVYDNTTMSQNVMFVCIGWRILASLLL